MDNQKKMEIAMFRFGVIASLIGIKKEKRGRFEELIKEIIDSEWNIPHTSRTFICRGTVLLWLKRYRKSDGVLESLMPRERTDKGKCRKMDQETELALVNLKKENRKLSVPLLIRLAKEKNIFPPDFKMSDGNIYRILKKHFDKEESLSANRLKFEAELPNDLWQSDCMHGPKVRYENIQRKTFLFAIIDDHSRIITHAQFYLKENLDCYIHCLRKALAKRGLPRKLYVDNGPCFRAARLKYSLASLGVSLLHARPYTPEGKGKIERWYRTIRMCFLPTLPKNFTLDELNSRLQKWIDQEYHLKKHSSIKKKPLDKYLKGLHLIRKSPDDLSPYFRIMVKRRVRKDRVVSLKSIQFEAPSTLIGKKIELRYDPENMEKVEAFFNDDSYGYLTLLDQHINSTIYRRPKEKKEPDNNVLEIIEDSYENGQLF